jgi:hypothetical protein
MTRHLPDMRTGLLLISLAVLAVTPLAGVRAAGRPMAAPPPVAKAPDGLRGPISPGPSAAPAATALSLKPRLPISSPVASAATGAGACRLTCAHSYYFCLSGADASYCPQAWTQCLTGCVHPAPAATP